MISLLTAGAGAVQGARRRAGSLLARALDRIVAPGNLFPALTWRGSGGTVAVVTSGQVDPAGGTGAYSIEDAAEGGVARSEMGLVPAPYASGHKVEIEFTVKKDLTATHFPDFRLEYTGGTTHRLELRLDTGQYAVNVGTWERIEVTDAGDWWHVRLRQAGEVGPTSLRFSMYAALGLVSGFPAQNVAATGSTTVYGARVSDPQLVEALRDTLAPGNLLPAPDALSWFPGNPDTSSAASGQADPVGGSNGWLLTDISTGFTGSIRPLVFATVVAGREIQISAVLKKDAAAAYWMILQAEFPAVAGGDPQLRVRVDTGAIVFALDGAYDEFSIDLGAWYYIGFRCVVPVGETQVRPRVFPAGGTTGSANPALLGPCTIYGARIEDPVFTAALGEVLAPGSLTPRPSYQTWLPSLGATVTTGQVDPAGGTEAVAIADNDGSFRHANPVSVPYVSGRALRASCLVKKQTSPDDFIQLAINYDSGATYHSIVMHPGDGRAQVRIAPVDEIDVVDLGAWWKVSFDSPGAVASSVELEVYPAMGAAASYPTTNVAATGSCTIYGARIELL